MQPFIFAHKMIDDDCVSQKLWKIVVAVSATCRFSVITNCVINC